MAILKIIFLLWGEKMFGAVLAALALLAPPAPQASTILSGYGQEVQIAEYRCEFEKGELDSLFYEIAAAEEGDQ